MQNAGLGAKGSNYGAMSGDSERDKLKKLVRTLLRHLFDIVSCRTLLCFCAVFFPK